MSAHPSSPASDPAIEGAVRMFERTTPNRFRELGVARARAYADVRLPGPLVDRVDDRVIPGGDAQPLPVRIYHHGHRPESPVLVFLHGGGWTLGSIDSHDALCRALCLRAQAVVVSVGYRLAPEHPFPAALEDAYAACEWVAAEAATLGADAERTILAGDSAGANLAAAVCLVARERGGPRFASQLLAYPSCDDVPRDPSMVRHAAAPFLDAGDIAWFRDLYHGGARLTSPYAWPALAETSAGLPPALVLLAENDPLHDSGLRYAYKLAGDGVRVRVRTYAGTYHAFLTLTPAARMTLAALADVKTWVQTIRSTGAAHSSATPNVA